MYCLLPWFASIMLVLYTSSNICMHDFFLWNVHSSLPWASLLMFCCTCSYTGPWNLLKHCNVYQLRFSWRSLLPCGFTLWLIPLLHVGWCIWCWVSQPPDHDHGGVLQEGVRASGQRIWVRSLYWSGIWDTFVFCFEHIESLACTSVLSTWSTWTDGFVEDQSKLCSCSRTVCFFLLRLAIILCSRDCSSGYS